MMARNHEVVGVELARGQALQIQVGLELGVELLVRVGSMPFRVERDIKLDEWSTRLIGAWPRRTAMPADE
jgi:hypothetical protein